VVALKENIVSKKRGGRIPCIEGREKKQALVTSKGVSPKKGNDIGRKNKREHIKGEET